MKYCPFCQRDMNSGANNSQCKFCKIWWVNGDDMWVWIDKEGKIMDYVGRGIWSKLDEGLMVVVEGYV